MPNCCRIKKVAWLERGHASLRVAHMNPLHCNKVRRPPPSCGGIGQRRCSNRIPRCKSVSEDRDFVSELPTRQIINQLKLLRQECRYIFDKSELVELLVQAREELRGKVIRLKLRQSESTLYSPKEYIIIPVDVGDEGFGEFALDSGASSTLITPEFRDRLGVNPLEGDTVRGLLAEGPTLRQRFKLPPMRLGGQTLNLTDGIVTTLRSPNLKSVDGMLGNEFLQQFDIDVDFEKQQVSFYPRGCACPGGLLDTTSLSTFSCTRPGGVHADLMALHVSLNNGLRFPAIVDITSSFSVMNLMAAQLGKIDYVAPTSYVSGSATNPAPTPCFRPAKPLMVTVGDKDKGDGLLCTSLQGLVITEAPVFKTLGMDKEPAMLLAMDVLKQKRLVLSFGQGKVFVGT